MYFIDSRRRTIHRYDFDLRGGMTVGDEGCLWWAIWDTWRLSRYSPDGEELAGIQLPVPRRTSCCFAGERLYTLYVTRATVQLSAAAPRIHWRWTCP
ncbi:hypothetical protein LMG23992_04294 [Cupriavidus laharis]|uniref:SMP-30/Gluconolactonase/LRE-like region domain-containing protein n=1 Tax=Cupriavidus laharis TaxID=151654 RepID=A0ABN7Z741_9BURK|nr:SMP-30/gluconolactonase/LRE family protein [Cupriavidus laharis]CAG9180645.1 hypothetical protein LMG23992_04294 [Cupriavidus laharis]